MDMRRIVVSEIHLNLERSEMNQSRHRFPRAGNIWQNMPDFKGRYAATAGRLTRETASATAMKIPTPITPHTASV